MTPARTWSAKQVAAAWREVLLSEVLPGVDPDGGKRLRGGEGKIYFNARYCDPTTGRFLTEDPSRKGVNWYAYCEDNPINKTDPDGLDSFASIFDRTTNTMTATYTPSARDVGASLPSTHSWAATNNPQSNTLSRTSPAPGQPYYPEAFPAGTWKLDPSIPGDTLKGGAKVFGPAAVPTKAFQTVTTYAPGPEGSLVPSGTTTDRGYWIHGGGWSTPNPAVANNVNDTTFGCIRMTNTDVKQFAALSDAALRSGGNSTITVGRTGGSSQPSLP